MFNDWNCICSWFIGHQKLLINSINKNVQFAATINFFIRFSPSDCRRLCRFMLGVKIRGWLYGLHTLQGRSSTWMRRGWSTALHIFMAPGPTIGKTTVKSWREFLRLIKTLLLSSTIYPVESKFVAALTAGEGWHNYHHAFPWDYRAAELGTPLNLTSKFIDFFAKYGVIYDRREATATMVSW